MIKLLMISTDRTIFDQNSAVRSRLAEQSKLVGELHVVVFTPTGEKFKELHISKHLTIYPTCSTSKWSYLPDAYKLGRSIIVHDEHPEKWLITTQDPFETGALGFLIGRSLRVPLHLQIHTDPWSIAWKEERLMNRMRFVLMMFLLRRAAGVRVVSARVEKSVLHAGVPRVCVTRIPIYTDVTYWGTAVPAFDLHASYRMFSKIVLSIGRLQPEKNFNGLIRAFARVRRIHTDALLIIVGSGPERERLISLARSLELGDAVIILPWARDVASYYKTSDLYVQPSFYEGWGLSVVEAMASGLPVVVTDVGLAGELVHNNQTGIIVPVLDEQALVDAMVLLLTDDTLRASLTVAAREEVRTCQSKAETLLAYQSSWNNAYLYVHPKKTTTKKAKK